MRRLITSGGGVFGICLLLVSTLSYFQSDDPLPTSWVLYIQYGTENQTVYLGMPDGRFQQQLMQIAYPSFVEIWGGLDEGQTFIYQYGTQQNGYQLWMYDIVSGQSSLLADNPNNGDFPNWELSVLTDPEQNDVWHIINMTTPAGNALYRYNHDIQRLERISPFYPMETYLRSGLIRNGEWLYYQITDHNGVLPRALIRHRVDGSGWLELIRFDDMLQIEGIDEDSISVVISRLEGENVFTDYRYYGYQITVGDQEVQLTEIPADGSTVAYDFGPEWCVIYQTPHQPPFPQYYLQNKTTGRRTFLMQASFDLFIFTADDEHLYYVENLNGHGYLKSLNIPSLEVQDLIPNPQWSNIVNTRHIEASNMIIFEAVQNSQSTMYRVNMDGSDLRDLKVFNDDDGYHYVDVVGDWIFVKEPASSVWDADQIR